MAQRKKPAPEAKQEQVATPEAGVETKPTPGKEITAKASPTILRPENVVTIAGKEIEIKSTEIGYFRNNVANFYMMLDTYPISMLLMQREGFLGQDDKRNGDKALMDWMGAVVNDPEFIHDHYNEIDVDTIYRMLEIFKRVNHLDEMEAKIKNVMSQGAAG